MRKFLMVWGVLFGVLLATPAAADAVQGNPHFVGNLTGARLDGAALVVTFKEAGLPSGAVETVTASATATANWFCVNRGSANPQAAGKRTAEVRVSKSGVFTADKNGTVSGTLTAGPPAAPPDFACPPGQTAELGSVTYSNVSVADATSGAVAAVSGAFKTGCLISGVRFTKVSCT